MLPSVSLVPDSAPSITSTATTIDNPASSQEQNDPSYLLSDLALRVQGGPHGPKNLHGQPHQSGNLNGQDHMGIKDMKSHGSEIMDLKQSGMSLSEYLSCATEAKRRLLPRVQEGVVVEASVRGLDDQQIQKCLERRMDREGWNWNVLETALKDFISEQKPHQGRGVNEAEQLNTGVVSGGRGNDSRPGAHEMTEDYRPRQRPAKKRRFIPIVPIDEEDLLLQV